MRCILFDLDGTIQDSERLAKEANAFAFQAVLGREATPQELDQLIGKPVPKVLAAMFPEHGNRILEKGIEYYEAHSHRIACYEGIEELLKRLIQDGYELGIVSSKPRKYIIRELESKSLLNIFRCIVGQEDTSEHKPNPEPLLLGAKLMGHGPEQCLYVGDQPNDILAAAHAGMKSAAALWGEGTMERLSPFLPSYIFTTPQSVFDFFNKAKVIPQST